MRIAKKSQNIGIGILAVSFALIVLFAWIPADTDTGVIDEWRRTIRIGDAMLPTFASIGLLLSGLGLAIQSAFSQSGPEESEISGKFFLFFFLLFSLSIGLMLHSGPIAVSAWFPSEIAYRHVFDTAPWKYLGFILGGTTLTYGLMSFACRELNWRNLMISLVSVTVIAVLYTFPSNSMLIPPNRDF